ncbi:MAG: efflux RND transporter periplasmic adaptor subunit [Anaerolineae bacterium]|nr:efflux RND transporter periplasmic adaptor subunit [Anaerolineae bacterium]
MSRAFLRLLPGVLLFAALLGPVQARPRAQGTLVASGVVRAREVIVASELAGRVLAVQADEGDRVSAGQVLVVLDDAPCRANLAQVEAAVQAAEAELAALKAGATPESLAAAEAQVAQARAALEAARRAWEDAVAARRSPQDLDAKLVAARARVAVAEQAVEAARAQEAQASYARDQLPWNSRSWHAAELYRQACAYGIEAAEADLAAAKAQLEGLEAIQQRPLALVAAEHKAEGAVKVAEAALRVAEAALADLLAGPSPADVAQAEARLRLVQAQEAAMAHQCDRMTLRSPVEGTVLSRAVEPGEAILPAAALMVVGDLRHVELVLYVPEPRVGEVALGQRVEVKADGLPDRTFIGQVVRIADRAEFTPRNVATREERVNTYFAVRVSIPNPEGLLKPGMSADATFQAASPSASS